MNRFSRTTWLLPLAAVAGCTSFAAFVAQLEGCSNSADLGSDASADGTTTPVPAEGGPSDASSTPPADAADAGDAADGSTATTTFTVPSGGGNVTVTTSAGSLTLKFPVSAASKTITITSGTAAGIGQPTTLGYVVLTLGPAGTKFSDPVVIAPADLSQVGAMFTLPDNGVPAEGLSYSAAKGGFQLNHFSSLVITPPGTICTNPQSNDYPDSGRCGAFADGGYTTFRTISCSVPTACVVASGSCCRLPTDTSSGCSADKQLYGVTWSDYSSASAPACDDNAGDWDGGDSGCGSSYVGISPGAPTDAGIPTCSGYRQCTSGDYSLNCDGTNCKCQFNGGPATATFPQGNTCDNGVRLRGQWVRQCNYPLHM